MHCPIDGCQHDVCGRPAHVAWRAASWALCGTHSTTRAELKNRDRAKAAGRLPFFVFEFE